jgi:thromboxane-A synthase
MNYLNFSSFAKFDYSNLNIFKIDVGKILKVKAPELDLAIGLKILGGSLAGFSLIYLGKVLYSYNFFKSRGIKTPKYKFFFGHLLDISERNYSECLQQWTKEYGKTYGYYEGHLPVLVTSDLDIVQEIFINQFSNFTARKKVPFVADDKDAPLFMSARNRWKRLRSVINPTFSPAKLKQITGQIRKCSDRLIELIDKQNGKEVNLTEYFNNLAMDVVWNCGYGLDIDCQKYPNDPFVVNVKRFFSRLQIFVIISNTTLSL